MYKNEILLIASIIILAISGLNGYLIEAGFLNINKSTLNFILDAFLIIISFYSIQNSRHTRKFLIVFLIFIMFTVITYIVNIEDLTIIIYLNGLREFIPYFIFPIIYFNLLHSKWRYIFIKKFNTFLYIFLVLQIPFSLYQFIMEGAGDAVGGTQGTGFSGILTFTVFLATFYLMTQNFDENNVIKSFFKKSYLIIFWLPAFINETKISYILIPLFLLLLVKIGTKNIPKYVYISLAIVPLLIFFNSIYQSITPEFDSNEFLSKDFLYNYLASDDEEQEDIPRFEKLAIFIETFDEKEILLGKGIGQFKGGTTLELTPFASMYDWLLQGSKPMLFFLLIQIGIIGTIIFSIYWIKLITFRYGKQKVNYSTNLLVFSTACFLIIQMYNDSFRSLFFCGIIIFIICYAISPPNTIKQYIHMPHRILL